MAMHIRNTTFHIPKNVLSLSLFPIGQHLHISFQIWIAENTPISRFTIHVMMVLRQSPMRIHDVVGKSAVCYPHHEGA